MRRTISYPLAALAVTAGSTLAVASPALAHGYVSTPPSRQALCASGAVADCGAIQFEPQSVEGPKGLSSCNGGLERFSVLADESRDWPARNVNTKVDFTWVLTARHRTADWQYFVDGTRVATIDGGNAQPDAVVSHQVDLSRFPGRHTVLAVWNIGDTANAFYSCIDLNVGAAATGSSSGSGTGSGSGSSSDSSSSSSADSGSSSGSATWAPNVSYQTGDVVIYEEKRYRCRQAHTSIVTWEPSIYTLALWLPL